MEYPLAPIPYCGAPPSPSELLERWNLDPFVIACLIAVASLYAWGARGKLRVSKKEKLTFYAGWFLASLTVISPLCALSVSLFSARITQHMILVLLAAPLVVAGRGEFVVKPLLRRLAFRPEHIWFLRYLLLPLPAAVLFATLLWFWHSPRAYAATFESSYMYWAMHLSLFAAALALWSALSIKDGAQLPQVMAAGVFSSIQMTFLGALITLAPRLLYAPHLLTTAAWQISPLQDQQIGGLIMWVPGCSIFLAVALFGLAMAMRRADRVYG